VQIVGYVNTNVEFHSKNKFEKLMNLVGFIIRLYHDARSPECRTAPIIFSAFENGD